ncbi:hypothetical protein ACJX0J_012623, partial [Zea mays]
RLGGVMAYKHCEDYFAIPHDMRFGKDQHAQLVRQLFHIRQKGYVVEYVDHFAQLKEISKANYTLGRGEYRGRKREHMAQFVVQLILNRNFMHYYFIQIFYADLLQFSVSTCTRQDLKTYINE